MSPHYLLYMLLKFESILLLSSAFTRCWIVDFQLVWMCRLVWTFAAHRGLLKEVYLIKGYISRVDHKTVASQIVVFPNT